LSIAAYSKFNQYKNKIHSLSAPTVNESLINETFLLEKDPKKKLEIYYAPFEHLNEQAKVVIIGITPGQKSFETVWNLKEQNLMKKSCTKSKRTQALKVR
jgi:hypothetical protein